jgi:hypothetical protein
MEDKQVRGITLIGQNTTKNNQIKKYQDGEVN